MEFLQSQGLALIERNYRCRSGEIDIIMHHRNELVFVEVRYRKSNAYGGAQESITPNKQRKIRSSAETFLQKHTDKGHGGCRFDVMAVSGDALDYQFDWIRNAF